jgi:hypothetical protein
MVRKRAANVKKKKRKRKERGKERKNSLPTQRGGVWGGVEEENSGRWERRRYSVE